MFDLHYFYWMVPARRCQCNRLAIYCSVLLVGWFPSWNASLVSWVRQSYATRWLWWRPTVQELLQRPSVVISVPSWIGVVYPFPQILIWQIPYLFWQTSAYTDRLLNGLSCLVEVSYGKGGRILGWRELLSIGLLSIRWLARRVDCRLSFLFWFRIRRFYSSTRACSSLACASYLIHCDSM